ncbi:MAG: methionine ABC transporter ATP-binding protein [Solirubrobacterales bacterium]
MIELTELTKVYESGDARHAALNGVSLSVSRGEIAAVIGPSGAGKSTLARCINMLDRPTSGRVLVDGADLTALRERHLRDARRSIGTVFQASSLLSRKTAAQNVALPLDFLEVERGQRDARVAELLERVGLGDRGGAYPHELSGGQRQRVGIARALALHPSVLLSDEATSGLDPATTKSVLAMLSQLRDDLGLTILLITHEMDVVREIADRAALIEEGRIVEQGRLDQLMRDPASALGASLLPHPAPAVGESGSEIWRVHYVSDRVEPDWIGRLSAAVGAPVSLLGASIEAIGAEPVGRATIALPPRDKQLVRDSLAASGLHAEPAGDPLAPVGPGAAPAASAPLIEAA